MGNEINGDKFEFDIDLDKALDGIEKEVLEESELNVNTEMLKKYLNNKEELIKYLLGDEKAQQISKTTFTAKMEALAPTAIMETHMIEEYNAKLQSVPGETITIDIALSIALPMIANIVNSV